MTASGHLRSPPVSTSDQFATAMPRNRTRIGATTGADLDCDLFAIEWAGLFQESNGDAGLADIVQQSCERGSGTLGPQRSLRRRRDAGPTAPGEGCIRSCARGRSPKGRDRNPAVGGSKGLGLRLPGPAQPDAPSGIDVLLRESACGTARSHRWGVQRKWLALVPAGRRGLRIRTAGTRPALASAKGAQEANVTTFRCDNV